VTDQDEPARADLSAQWLMALADRMLREVGALVEAGGPEPRPVPTLALDGEIRFASAADRAAFARELTATLTELVARYHDEEAAGGRSHRLLLFLYPAGVLDCAGQAER
jgi:hypothetical protein